MSDGDIGQLWCLNIVGDCLTVTPQPHYTQAYTHTLLHSQRFESIAPHPCVHGHMDAHKLTQVILESS